MHGHATYNSRVHRTHNPVLFQPFTVIGACVQSPGIHMGGDSPHGSHITRICCIFSEGIYQGGCHCQAAIQSYTLLRDKSSAITIECGK